MDLNAVKNIVPEKYIFLNEPMRDHTTICIGGKVKAFIKVPGEEALADLVRIFRKSGERFIITGNASNLLFSDDDMNIIVLSTDTRNSEMSSVRIIQGEEHAYGYTGTDALIEAGAGCMLGNLSMKAAQSSFGGLEFASGIPGTVGGAVAMNAGAYGSEIKDVIFGAVCIDREGNEKFLDRNELDLSYRNSAVLKKDLIVVKALFRLYAKDKERVTAEMRELNRKRREKQPLEYPSCGSTFKRPEGAYAAALIDEAGLKGMRIGDMQISEKHAGFMINTGNGTYADAVSLIKLVQDRVYKNSGIMLEPEIRIIS